MLVHLRELPMRPVALDELPLAGDRLGVALGVLRRPGVALLPLAVVGAVVAAERGQAAVAQLPDPGHGRVEERPVVGGDEQRAAASPEVLLDPLERADVEMVRRLVEEQQVRVGDDEPGERGAGLLAARQRRRRPDPVARLESQAGQRLVDALVDGVPAEDLELVLEVGVAALLDAMLLLVSGELGRDRVEMRRAGPDRGPEVGRGHERRVEVRLLGEQAERQPALPGDLAAVGLVDAGGDPEQRRLAGAVRPDEPDAVADRDRRRDRVEDDERPDLPPDAGQPQDRHRSAPDRGARRRPAGRGRLPGPLRPRLAAPSAPPASARRSPPRPAAPSSARRAAPATTPSRGSAARRPDPRPAAAGTTSRSASPARRRRSAGSAGRSAGTARRSAGRPRGAPASRRRRRAPCSRRSTSRAGSRPRRGSAGGAPRGAARRAAGASGRSAADGASPPRAPRRRRCCRRRRRTSGRAAAA